MKLVFRPMDATTDVVLDKPKPATQLIPEWYKNAPVRMDNEKIDALSKDSTETSNLTMKGCSPFLDALGMGYTYELPFDLEFRYTPEAGFSVRWATGLDLISGHAPEQYPGLPEVVGGSGGVFKWKFTFRVETPAGYSCLFTHPLNRHDLPFRTFSGVVDTDVYPGAVEFPFQFLDVIKEEIFILDKGTPLCQIIPFKRDTWESEKSSYDEKEFTKAKYEIKSKIVRSYKNQFWHKKSFN